jgi:hypothetical protein
MRVFVWRLFKKGLVVQVALTLLLASAVTIFAIYNSYIARESTDMSRRIKNTNPEGFYLVTDSSNQTNDNLVTRSFNRFYFFVASWYDAVTPSNYGHLPITYIDATHGTLRLDVNVAAMHKSVAERLGLQVGDAIILYPQGKPITVQVVDVYGTTPYNSGIDFGESVLVHTGEVQRNKHFLYQQIPGGLTRDTQIRSSLSALHSRGSVVRALHEDDPMGGMMVRSTYKVITQARLTLLLFLALAYLTAKLLSYMDTRRVLAILKALGLRNNQVSGTILGEAFLSPVFGSLLGGALSFLILRALNDAGYKMPLSLSTVLTAMAMVFPAVALGALVPARLAQVSTVNELLYERPVPLFRERIDRVRQRYPALEPLTARGVHLLRLNVYEGHFDGFIFRKLGDQVQAGEVIALEQSWWGLKTREYVSPIAGVIVYFENMTGMVGIEPIKGE